MKVMKFNYQEKINRKLNVTKQIKLRSNKTTLINSLANILMGNILFRFISNFQLKNQI